MRRRASQHYRAALPQRAETGPSPAIAFVISTLPDRTIPKARGCRRIPSGCTKVTTAFWGTSQERGRRPKRRSLDRNGPAQNRLLVIDVQEVVGPREFSDSLATKRSPTPCRIRAAADDRIRPNAGARLRGGACECWTRGGCPTAR